MQDSRDANIASREAAAVVDAVSAPPKGVIQIAHSRLVVVRSILLAWDLEKTVGPAGYSVHYLDLPWTDSIVKAIAEERLDLAIFNNRSVMDYRTETTMGSVHSMGIFGYSMGGKNFCILASRRGRWATVDTNGFLANPRNANIYVGLHSDRFRNLLNVLNITADQLLDKEIRIINLPEPNLDVFDTDPDALIICGQNARFEAMQSGELFELVRYESLDDQIRSSFRDSAANALIASSRCIRDFESSKIVDLFPQLRRNFYSNWQDPRQFPNLLDRIINECEFGGSDPKSREFVARHVLYETYRIGDPVW